MAYGKRNTISTDLSKVIFGLLGEPGVGKTSTMFKMAEKEFGSEGYLLLDVGSEWGTEYIEGVFAEQVETFKKFLDVTNDIIKNKDTDYPNLKIVIIDTLDALFEIGEPYLVKLYNQENMGAKNFTPCKTINQVEGGFMHGQDRLISIVVDQIVKLRKAGIGVWYTGHVKRRSNDDVFSGESYDQLTTNMSQRYFTAIKNKTHALGIAYIDRTLTQQEVGKENPITHKKEVITKIVSESRKVKFRDDSYTADSKSRLEYIVDEVPLSEDAILKAIKDAIEEGRKHPFIANKEVSPKQTTKNVKGTEDTLADHVTITEDEADELRKAGAILLDDEDNEPPFDVDETDDLDDMEDEAPFDVESAKTRLRDLFKAGTAAQKKAVKEIRGDKTLAQINDQVTIEKMLAVFDE